MGEVVKGNFGNREVQPQHEEDRLIDAGPSQQDDSYRDKKPVEDVIYLLKNFDQFLSASEQLNTIITFLQDKLRGYTPDKGSINLRRQGLVNSSLEDLMGHLLNSTENEWKMRPSFYSALILEYQARADAAVEAMPE